MSHRVLTWPGRLARVAAIVVSAVLLDSSGSIGQTRPAAAQPAQERFSDRYEILTEKNIFLRNRPRARSTSRAPSGPRRVEETFVLTGIALQEGRHVAFIENSGTRATQRLLPGEAVAGGKVISVELDSLEFESKGRRFRVAIGRNLLGDVFVAETPTATSPGADPSSAPTSAGSSGGATPPLAGGDADLSAEERMKRRRQQLGGSN
jgi:hypothetical protein